MTFAREAVSLAHVRIRHFPHRRGTRSPLNAVRVFLNEKTHPPQTEGFQKTGGRNFPSRMKNRPRTHRRVRQSARPPAFRARIQGDPRRKTQARTGDYPKSHRGNLEASQNQKPHRPRTRTGALNRNPCRQVSKDSFRASGALANALTKPYPCVLSKTRIARGRKTTCHPDAVWKKGIRVPYPFYLFSVGRWGSVPTSRSVFGFVRRTRLPWPSPTPMRPHSAIAPGEP